MPAAINSSSILDSAPLMSGHHAAGAPPLMGASVMTASMPSILDPVGGSDGDAFDTIEEENEVDIQHFTEATLNRRQTEFQSYRIPNKSVAASNSSSNNGAGATSNSSFGQINNERKAASQPPSRLPPSIPEKKSTAAAAAPTSAYASSASSSSTTASASVSPNRPFRVSLDRPYRPNAPPIDSANIDLIQRFYKYLCRIEPSLPYLTAPKWSKTMEKLKMNDLVPASVIAQAFSEFAVAIKFVADAPEDAIMDNERGAQPVLDWPAFLLSFTRLCVTRFPKPMKTNEAVTQFLALLDRSASPVVESVTLFTK